MRQIDFDWQQCVVKVPLVLLYLPPSAKYVLPIRKASVDKFLNGQALALFSRIYLPNL